MSVFLFVCPSRYDARHRKPRRGTGISPPDTFSFRSSFRFRSRFRSRSSSSSIISGDIFYCSGSRQLNHSSLEIRLVIQSYHLRQEILRSVVFVGSFGLSLLCSGQSLLLKYSTPVLHGVVSLRRLTVTASTRSSYFMLFCFF